MNLRPIKKKKKKYLVEYFGVEVVDKKEKKKEKLQKRGQVGFMLSFFLIIAIILVVGLFIGIGGGVINYAMDLITPELSGLGDDVAGANFTEIADYSIVPLNTFVQSFTWMGGFIYTLMILFLFIFGVSVRFVSERWLIGLYFAMALMLVVLSIFVSNIYQEVHDKNDDLGQLLQEQTLLSFLMIHSPLIFTGVIFLVGIIVFSGIQAEAQV